MKENMIEEKAYLFIDNYEVGVTNNFARFTALLDLNRMLRNLDSLVV